jgi:PilZ domain
MIEDQRPGQTQTILMNHPDRRKISRTPIHGPAYVNLEPYDNGGVVTDISSDGLRFHLVNPVEHGGVIRLSIFLGGSNHFQAIGELIWMDATRKIGGVRFTVLPPGAAEQILDWAKGSTKEAFKSLSSRETQQPSIPSQPSAPASRPQAPVTPQTGGASAFPSASVASQPAPPSQPASNVRPPWVPPSARPQVAPATADQRQGFPRPAPIYPQPSLYTGGLHQPNAMPWITHFDPEPAARGSSFIRGVLGGILICGLLGFAAWFALHNHSLPNISIPFINSLINPPASNPVASNPISTRPDSASSGIPTEVSPANSVADTAPSALPQPAPSTLRPAVQSGPPIQPGLDTLSTDSPAEKPIAVAPPDLTPPQSSSQTQVAAVAPSATLNTDKPSSAPSQRHIAKANVPPPPQSSDSGESQLTLARQYLDGRVQPRNAMVASQLLWSAVEKGNSAAEMDLADLYLHGDGVARNCDQARVLLSVASEKGNPEAALKLRELNRTGCR